MDLGFGYWVINGLSSPETGSIASGICLTQESNLDKSNDVFFYVLVCDAIGAFEYGPKLFAYGSELLLGIQNLSLQEWVFFIRKA